MSKSTRDRDSSIDGLLRRTLEARASEAPTGACLDADTLAAWADHALTASERAAVEAHTADCGRCQAVLAAMITTSPSSLDATPRWRMRAMRWLVPLTAAAAAAILWVAVPSRGPTLRQRVEPPAQVAETPRSSPAPSSAASADERVGQAAAPRLRRPANPAPDQLKDSGEGRQSAPPAAKPPRDLDKSTMVDAIAPSGTANAASPSATSAPPAAASPEPSAAAKTMAQRAAPMKSEARPFAAAAMPVIVSPNPAIRWRIIDGGAVQRTSDGGATWQTQQTGTTETLTAGSSPSPSVCWLVGPAGTVVVSTDDRSWRRVAFPEAVPLIAVKATDDLTATVTAADGTTFATVDGGATWLKKGDGSLF